MKRIGFKKLFICTNGLMLIYSIVLSGCTNKQPVVENTEKTVEYIYPIDEHVVPDPDENLIRENSSDWVNGIEYEIFEESLYRIAQVWRYEEAYDIELDNYYLQILSAPYKEWESVAIPYMSGEDEFKALDIRHGYKPEEVVGVSDGEIYIFFSGRNVDKKNIYALGVQHSNGQIELIKAFYLDVPQDFNADSYEVTYDFEDNLYLYYKPDNNGTLLNYNLSSDTTTSIKCLGNTVGQVYDNNVSKLVRIGNDKTNTYIHTLPDLESFYENDDSLYVEAFCVGENGYYLASSQGLWHVDRTGKLEYLMNFTQRGYYLNEVKHLYCNKSKLLCDVIVDGVEYLLEVDLEGKHVDEREEITIESVYENPTLNQLMSIFNRTNPRYKIKYNFVTDDTNLNFDFDKYCDDLRIKYANGEGSDLILSGILDISDLAKNGYILAVDDFFENESDYISPALDYGIYNGKRYGVPYTFYIELASYSSKYQSGKDQMTLDEFMDMTENSDIEVISKDISGYDFVVNYALSDNDNKDYIDWENNISNLESEKFIRLLKFADKYANLAQSSGVSYDQLLAKKEVASSEQCIHGEFTELADEDAIFGEELINIGYPRSSRNGIYAISLMMYLNANSKNPEGAKEFLRFIISDDIQMRIAENKYGSVDVHNMGAFPITKKGVERVLEKTPRRAEKSESGALTGTFSTEKGLTNGELEWAEFCIENLQPGNFYINEVMGIVSEELEAYFSGGRSAEETAQILDSRIQVYLDENK